MDLQKNPPANAQSGRIPIANMNTWKTVLDQKIPPLPEDTATSCTLVLPPDIPGFMFPAPVVDGGQRTVCYVTPPKKRQRRCTSTNHCLKMTYGTFSQETSSFFV